MKSPWKFSSSSASRGDRSTLASANIRANPYLLEYLDFPDTRLGSRIAANSAAANRPTGIIVLALGGKAGNDVPYLREHLPNDAELFVQDLNEDNELVTYQYRSTHERHHVVAPIEGRIEALAASARVVFIVAGLGGTTGTTQSLAYAGALTGGDTPVFSLVTVPFKFEAKGRERARDALNTLERSSRGCLAFRNEDLIRLLGPNTLLSVAFSTHQTWLVHGLSGLLALTDSGLFRRIGNSPGHGGRIVMGFARASGPERVPVALEAAYANPLASWGGERDGHVAVVLAAADMPNEAERQQAGKLAREFFPEVEEISVVGQSHPGMAEYLYATIFMFERIDRPDAG